MLRFDLLQTYDKYILLTWEIQFLSLRGFSLPPPHATLVHLLHLGLPVKVSAVEGGVYPVVRGCFNQQQDELNQIACSE